MLGCRPQVGRKLTAGQSGSVGSHVPFTLTESALLLVMARSVEELLVWEAVELVWLSLSESARLAAYPGP
jgi:hypothetical protein